MAVRSSNSEPISIPERPNIFAFVVRLPNRSPMAFVFHRSRSSSYREVAADILNTDPTEIRKQAALDAEPAAWLAEVVPEIEAGNEVCHIRPLLDASEVDDDDLARLGLLACKPRLIDGTPFDIELQDLGENSLLVHMAASGRFHTLGLGPQDSRDKIAEAAEAALSVVGDFGTIGGVS